MTNFVSYDDLKGRFENQKEWLDKEFQKKANTVTINNSDHQVVSGKVDLGTVGDEFVDNKISAVTNTNKTSTTLYPSINALTDWCERSKSELNFQYAGLNYSTTEGNDKYVIFNMITTYSNNTNKNVGISVKLKDGSAHDYLMVDYSQPERIKKSEYSTSDANIRYSAIFMWQIAPRTYDLFQITVDNNKGGGSIIKLTNGVNDFVEPFLVCDSSKTHYYLGAKFKAVTSDKWTAFCKKYLSDYATEPTRMFGYNDYAIYNCFLSETIEFGQVYRVCPFNGYIYTDLKSEVTGLTKCVTLDYNIKDVQNADKTSLVDWSTGIATINNVSAITNDNKNSISALTSIKSVVDYVDSQKGQLRSVGCKGTSLNKLIEVQPKNNSTFYRITAMVMGGSQNPDFYGMMELTFGYNRPEKYCIAKWICYDKGKITFYCPNAPEIHIYEKKDESSIVIAGKCPDTIYQYCGLYIMTEMADEATTTYYKEGATFSDYATNYTEVAMETLLVTDVQDSAGNSLVNRTNGIATVTGGGGGGGDEYVANKVTGTPTTTDKQSTVKYPSMKVLTDLMAEGKLTLNQFLAFAGNTSKGTVYWQADKTFYFPLLKLAPASDGGSYGMIGFVEGLHPYPDQQGMFKFNWNYDRLTNYGATKKGVITAEWINLPKNQYTEPVLCIGANGYGYLFLKSKTMNQTAHRQYLMDDCGYTLENLTNSDVQYKSCGGRISIFAETTNPMGTRYYTTASANTHSWTTTSQLNKECWANFTATTLNGMSFDGTVLQEVEFSNPNSEIDFPVKGVVDDGGNNLVDATTKIATVQKSLNSRWSSFGFSSSDWGKKRYALLDTIVGANNTSYASTASTIGERTTELVNGTTSKSSDSIVYCGTYQLTSRANLVSEDVTFSISLMHNWSVANGTPHGIARITYDTNFRNKHLRPIVTYNLEGGVYVYRIYIECTCPNTRAEWLNEIRASYGEQGISTSSTDTDLLSWAVTVIADTLQIGKMYRQHPMNNKGTVPTVLTSMRGTAFGENRLNVSDVVDASGNSLVDWSTGVATVSGGGSGGGKDVKSYDASGAENTDVCSASDTLVSLKIPYVTEEADGSKWLNVYNVTKDKWEQVSVTTLAIEV